MATARLRNVNPLGRVDLPLIARQGDVEGEGEGCLEPGEEFDVSPEHAAILLEQASNYEPVDAAAIAIDSRIAANAFRHAKKTTPKKPARKRAPRKPAAAKAATPAGDPAPSSGKGDA